MSQALLVFFGSRTAGSKKDTVLKWNLYTSFIFLSQDQGKLAFKTYISLATAEDWGNIEAGEELFSSDLKMKEYVRNLIKVIKCLVIYRQWQLSLSLFDPNNDEQIGFTLCQKILLMCQVAVRLGANEERASTEMGEVLEFMQKLFNLSVKFNTRSRKQEDSNSLQNIGFEKVGNLQEGYPEVCQLSASVCLLISFVRLIGPDTSAK